MPDFTPDDIDIDPREFVDSCSRGEIKELIEYLVDENHLPESVITFKSEGNDKRGRMESDFIEKLDLLKNKYYSLSVEEEDSIEKIFKKHL
jgi:hypothetical protein